jgi:hypothetical protein
MKRLGYTRYVAQGGDRGSPISNEMAKLAPPELLGIHVNLPGVVPPEIMRALQSDDAPPTSLSVDEQNAFKQLKLSFSRRRGYGQIMGTRPQTLSGLADSPAGLAAWLLDHGDGYAEPAAAMTSAVLGHTVNGHPAGDLTRDDVLDNITLYWLTNTAISSARLYWENKVSPYLRANVCIAAAVTVFPWRKFSGPAELDGTSLPQADLLPPSRQRRPLRSVGTATTLFRRGSRGFPTASQIDLKTRAREFGAPFFDLTMLPIAEISHGQDRYARNHRP